jgi:hypothetical protein
MFDELARLSSSDARSQTVAPPIAVSPGASPAAALRLAAALFGGQSENDFLQLKRRMRPSRRRVSTSEHSAGVIPPPATAVPAVTSLAAEPLTLRDSGAHGSVEVAHSDNCDSNQDSTAVVDKKLPRRLRRQQLRALGGASLKISQNPAACISSLTGEARETTTESTVCEGRPARKRRRRHLKRDIDAQSLACPESSTG